MFFEKIKRRPVIALNVIALVDISALLIIFMIMSTYFGESSIIIPSNISVPQSVSKESVENAPHVAIFNNEVSIDFLKQNVKLEVFQKAEHQTELNTLKESIKKFVDSIPPELRQSGALLNLIADQNTPYKNIFDVVKAFREAGFQSILFVAKANK